jgi:bifunctional DNase/RNase
MSERLSEMVVDSVRIHMLTSQHVVVLRESDRERYLPIWIGPWEANAIAMRLQGQVSDRPMTHDLFRNALDELGVVMRRVIVTDLAEDTFRARIILEQDDQVRELDARPSDAIALAVRAQVPIFATEAVLDRAGVVPQAEEDEKLSVFREFVNSLDIDGEGDVPGEERRRLD